MSFQILEMQHFLIASFLIVLLTKNKNKSSCIKLKNSGNGNPGFYEIFITSQCWYIIDFFIPDACSIVHTLFDMYFYIFCSFSSKCKNSPGNSSSFMSAAVITLPLEIRELSALDVAKHQMHYEWHQSVMWTISIRK